MFLKSARGTGWRFAFMAMLSIVILLLMLASASARPEGKFENLTGGEGGNPRDDVMPDMKVDSVDDAHLVYQAYDGNDHEIYYKTNAGGAWVTVAITNDSLNDIDPRIVLDTNDHARVTWSHWDGNDYEIYYADNSSGSWVTTQVTDNDVDDSRADLALASGAPTQPCWIACESFNPDQRRSIINLHTDASGTWEKVDDLTVDLAVPVKKPSLAINGDAGHLVYMIQDNSYWKIIYELFDCQDKELVYGLAIDSNLAMQIDPDVEVYHGLPLIAYSEWADGNYDIFVASTTDGFGWDIKALETTTNDEYAPVINYNVTCDSYCISYQSYTNGKDYKPGLYRHGPKIAASDSYSELTSKVTSRAVTCFSNNGRNVHMVTASLGAESTNMDIFYGFLTPTPHIYAISCQGSEPGREASGYPGSIKYDISNGADGDPITLKGTDFGTVEGLVKMHVLVNNVDTLEDAPIKDWTDTVINCYTPVYNYGDYVPTDGDIRVLDSDSKVSNRNCVFHPLYPSITSLEPTSVWPYDWVTLKGKNLGKAQESSVVIFGNGYTFPGPDYIWKNDEVHAKVPAVASEGKVQVRISSGDHDLLALYNGDVGVPYDLILTDLDWYFAEGYTGPGFQEYICVLNPNDVDVQVKFYFMLEDSEDNFTKEYKLGAHQRFTLNINGEVPNANVSVQVKSSGRVICERPIYFNYAGVWTGGHDVIGANAPSNEWYFAEGTTRAGFDEWLCIMNPDEYSSSSVTATYMNATGDTVVKEYNVNPASRFTVNVNKEVGADQDVSVKLVTNGAPVVAERPMYFNYAGAWTGGHITMGATKLDSQWYFAEGTTRAGFDEWLCINNPGKEDATATVTYYLSDGPAVVQQYSVKAESRYTVKVNDAVGAEKDVSISVVTDKPTVVERPMYFNYAGAWTGGHDVIGSNHVTEAWYLAEGTNQPGFHEWLCILNSNDEVATVGVTYILGTGEMIGKTYTVPNNSRYTVFVNDEVPAGSDISAVVTSDIPILVERPMYFDFQGWTGGHDVIGYTPLYFDK